MNDNVQIVPMMESDIDEVYKLGLRTKELQIDSEINMFYPPDYLKLAISNPHYVCLVAKVNNKLAGFRLAQIDPELHESYLSDIVISPEFRGKGIGKMLFDKSIQILREKNASEWVWALVEENNHLMQEFIEKKGFTKGRKFYFYYKSQA